MAEKRIISLLPAATEIVCALGLEDQLVGRSHECDFPDTVKRLPVCSAARVAPGASSAGLHSQVRSLLDEALSIYTIDKEVIRDLRPDVVITQTQCEVCAVSLEDVTAELQGLVDKPVEIISLEAGSLPGILADIRNVAAALGVQARAEVLVEELEERLGIIRHKLKFIGQKPRVACIEWLSPLMAAGNWTPEMITIAGGQPLLAADGDHSPVITAGQLGEADPEVIVIMPCGFSVDRTLSEIGLLLELPGWQELSAVRQNRVYIADGNHYFNRPGPRIVDSAEILAEIINPRQFVFGYEGEGWVRFDMQS